MEITPMREEDVSELAAIDKLCFSIPWSEQSFAQEFENPVARYFIARDNGRCIGYVGYWNVSGEGDITNIAVLSEFRRQGIASAMLEAVIHQSASSGLLVLTLEVRRSNTAARRLYEKYGFEIIGERKHYYSDNREDALIMRKSLNKGS